MTGRKGVKGTNSKRVCVRIVHLGVVHFLSRPSAFDLWACFRSFFFLLLLFNFRFLFAFCSTIKANYFVKVSHLKMLQFFLCFFIVSRFQNNISSLIIIKVLLLILKLFVFVSILAHNIHLLLKTNKSFTSAVSQKFAR